MGHDHSTDKPPTSTPMENTTNNATVTVSSLNGNNDTKYDENKRPRPLLVATNIMPSLAQQHASDENHESPFKKNKNNLEEATTTTTTTTNTHVSASETATTTNNNGTSNSNNTETSVEGITNYASSDASNKSNDNGPSIKTILDSDSGGSATSAAETSEATETQEPTSTTTNTISTNPTTTIEPNSHPMEVDTSLNDTTSTSSTSNIGSNNINSHDSGSATSAATTQEEMTAKATSTTTTTSTNTTNEPFIHSQPMDIDTSLNDTTSTNTPLNVSSEANNASNNDDPHEIHRRAMETTRSVLRKVQNMLKDNPQFCSEQRQLEWNDEIMHRLQRHTCPQTTIGVLGNTGVGKSSLLNALLDEASVLPTSGSRGCTAAVVELRFNQQLLDIQQQEPETKEAAATTASTDTQQSANQKKPNDEKEETAPVYQGVVQFISPSEWSAELKVLLAECSTHEEKTIYARVPEDSRQPDAAAAWAKINQVYGKNFLEQYHTQHVDRVYNILMSNPRVKNLLTPPPGEEYKSITVEEGLVNAAEAAKLVASFSSDGSSSSSPALGGRLKRAKKKWAKDFRAQINGYVYRNNATAAQTWPLIRKVVLQGPWAVLKTGACLVDLPGTRDANAARAKVAENYLQHLNEIWIVAPIQRAVDDGTAKELLGESFKRRLLMDGNYSSVSFICTQTDDIEATETMRDHSDVAEEMGLWPEMNTLNDQLMDLEKQSNEMKQQEEDLATQLEEARDAVKDSQEEINEATEELSEQDDDDEDDDDDDDDGVEFDEKATQKQRLETLQTALKEKQQAVGSLQLQLELWRQTNKDKLEDLDASSRLLQRQLKGLCARVRNKYSTTCLQQDFRAGLDEMTRRDDEDEVDPTMENLVIPADWQMQVFAISSNDYLKVSGIKPSSDGPPNTFANEDDTQIPALKAFVHETTAKHSVAFIEDCVNTASDLIDRVKLVATESSDGASSRMTRKCRSVFELEMMSIAKKLDPVVNEFKEKMHQRVNTALKPSLEKGAKKGRESALQTASSWGSKSRRTRIERGPEKNGLYWSTYFATVRRDGVYVSGCAGEIDFNQELCDPMEKEFSADWQRVFDASLRQALRTCEQKVLHICTLLDQSLASALTEKGIREDRLTTLMTAANRSCRTNLTNAFQGIAAVATNTQRDLNRSLLPLVKKQMEQGYQSVISVPGGPGKFARMKVAMEDHCTRTVSTMFDDTTIQMLTAIGAMVEQLSGMLVAIVDIIEKTLSQVYSVLWDGDGQEEKAAFFDPIKAQEVRECRDRVLPEILELQSQIISAMGLLGIEREQLDLEMMGVESWEDRIEKKRKEAEENGLVVDLCDDDSDVDGDKKPAAIPPTMPTVKRE